MIILTYTYQKQESVRTDSDVYGDTEHSHYETVVRQFRIVVADKHMEPVARAYLTAQYSLNPDFKIFGMSECPLDAILQSKTRLL
jgi:hypothetical protein